MEEIITLNSTQRVSLKLKTITANKKETNFVDKLLRKHTKSEEDLSLFVQFRPNEAGFGWSGPVCVASLGRFFLKFRKSLEFPERQLHQVPSKDKSDKFAAVHVVEEGSVIVLHFFSPPNVDLPYRVENLLRDGPITYYQKVYMLLPIHQLHCGFYFLTIHIHAFLMLSGFSRARDLRSWR